MRSKTARKSDRKRKVLLALTLLLVVLTPLIILLLSFDALKNTELFYSYEFRKNAAYENRPDADEISGSVMDFLDKGIKSSLFEESFEQDEISHLEDVRNIIVSVKIIMWALILIYVLVLAYLWNKAKDQFKELYTGILQISGLTSIFFIIIVSLMLINFEFFFVKMHQVLFPHGNWQFAPESMLMTLYGGSFFGDYLFCTVILGLLFSGVITTIGFIIPWIKKKQKS